MTGLISTYLRDKLINHTFRNTAYTTPGTSIYLSLHDGDPNLTGANEVSGGSYARVQATAWDAPALRTIANTNDVTFTTLTVDLGTATYLCVFDAATSGNCLWQSDAFSLALTVGSAPQFEAGGIDISVGDNISTYLAHKWLNHVFRNTAYTTPGTSLYASLHTGSAGLVGSAEVSGNNYARLQATSWSAPSNGSTHNTAIYQFATPSGTWGTLQDFGVWDSLTSGNFLGGGSLADTYEALASDAGISFGVNEFTINAV